MYSAGGHDTNRFGYHIARDRVSVHRLAGCDMDWVDADDGVGIGRVGVRECDANGDGVDRDGVNRHGAHVCCADGVGINWCGVCGHGADWDEDRVSGRGANAHSKCAHFDTGKINPTLNF
jgi:hypothetical protein